MEQLDIYDNNGNFTGKTIVRNPNMKLKKNEHIALAVIFIENNEGKFLIQKTSKEKGSLYSSTGGHLKSGETPLEAIKREVKEELSIDIDNDIIKEYGYISYDMPLRYLFYIKKDIDINNIKLQNEEVEFVKYMSKDQIDQLIKDNQMLKSHAILFNELIKKHNK